MDLFLIFTVFLSIYLNSFHELLLISDTCGSPDSSKTVHAAAPARPADVIAERVMMPGQQKRDLSDSRPGILLCSVILYLKVSLLCHIYSLPLIFQAAFIIKSLYGRNVNENGKKVYLLFTWRGIYLSDPVLPPLVSSQQFLHVRNPLLQHSPVNIHAGIFVKSIQVAFKQFLFHPDDTFPAARDLSYLL